MDQNNSRTKNDDGDGIYYHPVSGQPIYGRLLEEGEILAKDDVFASSCGTWQKVPCPGLKIGTNTPDVLWLRPAPTVPSADSDVDQFISPTAGYTD